MGPEIADFTNSVRGEHLFFQMPFPPNLYWFQVSGLLRKQVSLCN